MTVLHVRSKTGPDGKLQLGAMDIGVPDAEVEVTVTVPQAGGVQSETSKKEWEDFVRRTAGSIQDPTFRRHPQGEYPQREPFE